MIQVAVAGYGYYGAAKAFNEGLLASFSEMCGLDYVAFHYFNVYGPRMDTHGAVPSTAGEGRSGP